MAVEFSHPLEEGGVGNTVPFEAVGAAVDEGAMCAEGTHESVQLESMEGEQITDEDWAEMLTPRWPTGPSPR